jgi:hypothetical protein
MALDLRSRAGTGGGVEEILVSHFAGGSGAGAAGD